MNKEEIEKKKKMLRDFSEKGQGQRVFFEEDLELIRDILKELEQKESILNKVTDKLKEPITDKNIDIIASKLFKIVYKDIINLTKDKIINFANEYRKDLLEIIEGEKE